MTEMTLKIAIPTQMILEKTGVTRIVIVTTDGCWGILPRRLDFTACLVPGIFLFETEADGERCAAIDEGIITKTGADVYVAVRNAVVAKELGTLKKIVHDTFMVQSEQDKKIRTMLTKLESDFMKHVLEFRHHG